MAAIIILVNREIVNPGWFLPKNVIYVVKKLATVVFEDFFGGCPYQPTGIISEIVKNRIYEVLSFFWSIPDLQNTWILDCSYTLDIPSEFVRKQTP